MPRGNYKNKNVQSQFPAPRYMTVRDTPDQQNAILFFKYWADLPESMRDLAHVTTYRTWPRIDLRLTDPDRKTIETKLWEGPIPFAPDEYKDYFLKNFGSGEWRCILKEKGVAGKVIECFFGAKTSPLDDAPPKIDPRTVCVGEFENRGYIDWAHNHGTIFPWEQDQEAIEAAKMKEEEETMTGEVVKGLTDMAERVVQSASEKAQLSAEKAQLESELKVRQAEEGREKKVSSDGVTESIRLVTGTAEKMVEMVTKNAGAQFNPVELINTVAQLNKRDDEGVKALAAAVEKSVTATQSMHTETLKFFGEQITKITTTTVQTQTTVERKSWREEVQEMREAAEMFGWRRPDEVAPYREREPETPAGPPPKTTMQQVVEALPVIQVIFALGANMMANWAAARAGNPAAVENPNEALNRARQQAQHNASAAPGADGTAQPPSDPRAQLMAIIDSQMFKTGFINHFFGGASCDGHTFAEFVNTEGTMNGVPKENGRKVYMFIREFGKEGFDIAVRGTIDIWSRVQSLPAKYEQFISEFLEYDEWMAGEDEVPEESTGNANAVS